jgi:hypothetical protein
MRWLPPKRSKEERREDIGYSLWEVVSTLGFLIVGLLVCGAGLYFRDNAVLGIGMLIAFFGGYVLLQSLFGLLIDTTIGKHGFTLVIVIAIIGFFLFQGYALVTKSP